MPELQLVQFSDFSGGLNVDTAPINLSEDELSVAKNIDYFQSGNIKSRPEFEVYNDSLPAQAVKMFEWTESDGSTNLMAVLENEDLVKIEGNDYEHVMSLSNINVDYFVFQEHLYILDGNQYWRIDEGTMTYEPVPEEDFSEEVSGAEEIWGSPGSHDLIDEDIVEGSVSITHYRDETDVMEQGEDFEVNYPEGIITVLDDSNFDDDELYLVEYDYQEPDINNLDPIRNCQYAVFHGKSNRIFAAGNVNDRAAVYYSEMLEPEHFPELNVIYPEENAGPITGLEVLNEMVLVFFRNSIWVWRGIDPETDAVWEKLPASNGAINFDAIAEVDGGIAFLHDSGLYLLNENGQMENISLNKVNSIIRNDIGNRLNVHVDFDALRKRLFLAYSETSGKSDTMLVFDADVGAFSIWDLNGKPINSFVYQNDGDFLLASDKIYKMAEGAIGEDIFEVEIETPPIYVDGSIRDKILKRLMIKLHRFPDEIEAKYILPSKEQEISIEKELERFRLHERTTSIKLWLRIVPEADKRFVFEAWGVDFENLPEHQRQVAENGE